MPYMKPRISKRKAIRWFNHIYSTPWDDLVMPDAITSLLGYLGVWVNPATIEVVEKVPPDVMGLRMLKIYTSSLVIEISVYGKNIQWLVIDRIPT